MQGGKGRKDREGYFSENAEKKLTLDEVRVWRLQDAKLASGKHIPTMTFADFVRTILNRRVWIPLVGWMTVLQIAA